MNRNISNSLVFHGYSFLYKLTKSTATIIDEQFTTSMLNQTTSLSPELDFCLLYFFAFRYDFIEQEYLRRNNLDKDVCRCTALVNK